ncbi:MAG: Unknown protein [uncultured Sulfurovum sp.]|uniref:Peptidase M15C domain-containing protein n=1 Tax=uncultured Sulfurovum sp. TaxID=269237 RepID=A0A6S6SNI0_9BACT|nr:MAG: Unknown protein [uncultured Sulfurovum sp.]
MIKNILLTTTLLTTSLFSQYNFNIQNITPEVKERMLKADSWRQGCPVHLNDLRYINVNYFDFNSQTVSGEIIVHKEVADDVVNIFADLYAIGYPVRQMRLVADFGANDWESIEADNTSAFNCRPVTGKKKKWSKHAYGKAIDINPIENPYVNRKGYISHKASWKYKKRVHKVNSPADRAVLLKNDKATKIFKSYGWTWGGDWRTIKDYQHFVKK